MDIEEKNKNYEHAKELVSPQAFINVDRISIFELIGKKVILVDFWTFSCINCLRTIPFLNEWYKKYKNKGLEIVGVHTPEFQFEKDYANVKNAVNNFSIQYPIVLDSEFGTWNAYNNRYWPGKYLIDIDGYIIYEHHGEGDYGKMEEKIQEALNEQMERQNIQEKITEPLSMPHNAQNINFLEIKTPEIYFGANQNFNLVDGAPQSVGPQTFSEPTELKFNGLYLVGDWNFTAEYAENLSPNAKIMLFYHAKNVYFVAGSKNGVKIKVLQDKKELGDAKGKDVLSGSEMVIKEEKLYKLIDNDKYDDYLLEITIENPGLQAFTFTFG